METRLPASAHTSQPWRIHELAKDFRLLDVWSVPTPGGPHDFPRLVELMVSLDVRELESNLVKALFGIRLKLGELLGWDEDRAGVGGRVTSLAERLPEDLRRTVEGDSLAGLPATPLYVTDDELAAEIANRTVHGVLHVGWVEDADGSYRGQMAILVKPNGFFGEAYLAAINPFRHLFVYPVLLRDIESRWESAATRKSA